MSSWKVLRRQRLKSKILRRLGKPRQNGTLNIDADDFKEHVELSQQMKATTLLKAVREGLTCSVRGFLRDETNRKEINELDDLGLALLHHASRYNQVDVAKLLIEYGADINIQSEEGLTPLHVATRSDAKDTLKYLLFRNADTSISDNQGNTALHLAVKRNSVAITDILLRHPTTQVDTRNNTHMTSLHLACINGGEEIAKMLIMGGADPRARSGDNLTPIHLAMLSTKSDLVKMVVNQAWARKISAASLLNDTDMDGNTALHLAMHSADQEIVDFCLRNGADIDCPNHCRNAPLHFAAKRGHLGIVRLLVERGADIHVVDKELQTPLHCAAVLNHADVVRLLVESGADIEASDTKHLTPFLCAVAYGAKEALQELYCLGADISVVDLYGRNSAQLCIENGQIEVLTLMVANNMPCSHNVDMDGRFPIHYAALAKNHKILEKLLVAMGPISNQRDSNYQTPLHLAAQEGLVEHVELLVKYAGGCHLSDDHGRTPLHLAAQGRNRKVCSVLLKAGSQVDAKDNNRCTPLMLAASSGCLRTSQLLLDHHAGMDEVNTKGQNALSVAITSGKQDCVNLLLDRNASVESPFEINSLAVAMTLVNHDRWQEMLMAHKNCLANLVQHFPEAAKVVLDKSILRTGLPRDPSFTITYDFRLLDLCPSGLDNDATGVSFLPSVMAKYAREDLLLHPLTQKLVDSKWNRAGRFSFYFSFFWYVVFLATYTTFVLSESKKTYFTTGSANSSMSESEVLAKMRDQTPYNVAFKWFSLVYVCVNIIKEIAQMYVQRANYFRDPSNLFEWSLYISTLLFLIPYIAPWKAFTGSVETKTFWSIAVASIFLAYFDLVLFLSQLRNFGLYYAMFLGVTRTVVHVFLTFSIFLLAFAISFYILFNKEGTFRHLGFSIMRTVVMMTGELDYQDTFVANIDESNSRGALSNPIPIVAQILLFFFILFLSIVVMNLLVGLAVGDIEAIRRTGRLSRLARTVSYIVALQKKYPSFIMRRLYRPRLEERPFSRCTNPYLKTVAGQSGLLDSLVDLDENPNDGDLQNIIRHVTKNKRRIKSLVIMIEAQNRLLRGLASKRARDRLVNEEDWGMEEQSDNENTTF